MNTHNLFERLMSAAELPSENITGLPLVEILGKRRVIIENHQGVMQYCSDLIVIRAKGNLITISGSCMVVSYISKTQLVISGNIFSVALGEGD